MVHKSERSNALQDQDDLQKADIETITGKVPQSLLGWIPSYSADTPDCILRQAFEEHGVLMIKNVMPRELVLETRQRFFDGVKATGVLKSGTQSVDGIFCGTGEDKFRWPKMIREGETEFDDGSYSSIVSKMHLEDDMNQFCNNPWLRQMVHRLRPDFHEPFCLRRQILRTNLPHSASAIGLHYDQRYLRHGPPTFLTSWVPIGDCDVKSGGLIYLEDSKGIGKRIERDLEKLGREKRLTEEELRDAYNSNMTDIKIDIVNFALTEGGGRRWLIGNFEAGDAVFHDAFTIHASAQNKSPNGTIRLSADLRFADRKGKFDPRWNKPLEVHDGL